ncbi:MAG TPA: hypothetical protein VL358_09775 [Caulobacteraceae bacterium]|jgi:hypothetical protein|nr:hypothetical protein [Caulobacteraceae bacterium]
MKSSVLWIAALGRLAACDAASSGAHWREVGSLDDGAVPFVEVETAFAMDGSVYRDAARRLCTRRCTEVGFFLPGDTRPPSGPREAFDQAGGWSHYAPAAVYSAGGGVFTRWDCIRAGEADAPVSALCGEGAKTEFDSVLRMAFRDGWTTGCRLRATDNRALLKRYLAPLPQAKREQLAGAYDDIVSSSRTGPDDPADCRKLRSRVVDDNRSARAFLTRRMASRARTGSEPGSATRPRAGSSATRTGKPETAATAAPPPPPAPAKSPCIRVLTDPSQSRC